jgi:hypothetical protein
MKICLVGTEMFHADRQTHTHDEADSHFSQFSERALKGECSSVSISGTAQQ